MAATTSEQRNQAADQLTDTFGISPMLAVRAVRIVDGDIEHGRTVVQTEDALSEALAPSVGELDWLAITVTVQQQLR